MKLEALVAPLRANVVSGASVIARTGAEVVRRAVLGLPADDPRAFRQMLVSLSIAILEAQPAMAPLVALTARVLNSFDSTTPLGESRDRVLEAAEAFRDGLSVDARRVAERAGDEVREGSRILTLSYSSTVAMALEGWGPEKGVLVTCLESRPVSEGKQLAGRLARAGMPVTFAVDAAAGTLIRQTELVLLGADSVGDRGIVNKIGSLPLALSAREAGVPLWALVDHTKLLPPGFPQGVEDDRPGEDVWRGPAGVEVWNRYFEFLPTDLATLIIMEEGPLAPQAVDPLRSSIPVPTELRAWADARRP